MTFFQDKFIHLTGQKGFDYDQITDEVFIGTNMCCQFGFSKELLAKGIRADISLEKDRIDAPGGVDYYLWLPTEDHQPPSPCHLDLGVKVLDFFVKNKIKVYLHCKNGHGRAPTLVAAYLKTTGMRVEEAIDFIKSKRPNIHLKEGQVEAIRRF